MAEHHFQPEGTECIPNLLMMATHLCGVTKNLNIGCGFNIVPMWHPLRLAEDYAMADILTGGRVIFGIGRGYHTREVETFGSPLIDQDANRELFEEGVEVIFKAFEEERFSHKGKYFTLPPEVPYRGYTLEGDHAGAGAVAPAGRMLAADPERLASAPSTSWPSTASAGVIGGGSAEGGAVERHMTDSSAAYAAPRHRAQAGERLALGYQFCIAESREAGIAQGRQLLRREHEDVRRAPAGARHHRPADRRHARSPARAQHETAAHRGCGEGGRLSGRHAGRHHRGAEEVEQRYPGLERVICTMPLGTHLADTLEQLDRFAKEVMPAFRPARAAAAAGLKGRDTMIFEMRTYL